MSSEYCGIKKICHVLTSLIPVDQAPTPFGSAASSQSAPGPEVGMWLGGGRGGGGGKVEVKEESKRKEREEKSL